MKSYVYFLVTFIILLQTSCVFPSSNERERERRRQEKLDEYNEVVNMEGEIIETPVFDTTDFTYIEISKDSLDLKLYELITDHAQFAQDVLMKNIETLISKGAKPNAIVEAKYMVRKTGTYIPIIKHFYRNKYREHTKITTCMHAAVETRNIAVVKKLIEHGGNINVSTPYGTYPFDVALQMSDNKMIDFLIEAGADITKADLANSKNTALIEKLVKLGADPKTIDINYALRNISELKRLLALKPAINDTELDFGIIMSDNEIFDLLISNGMTTDATGNFPDRCPVIFAAIKYDNFRAFKILHEKGASLTGECKNGFGDTPLQAAVYYQRIDVIKYLLEHKVSPNEKDWTKKSVLIMACNTDNDEILKILLDAGAELEYKGYFSKTPLMHSVEFDKYISADYLISRKANVNFKDRYGETVLHVAIKKNNYPMIKLLVDNGADINVKYKSLDLAQFAEYNDASPAIVTYLKNKLGK